MKKIFVACFLTAIMVLLPFGAVARTVDISNIKAVSSLVVEDPPELFLTNVEYNELFLFIESHFDGDTEEQAKSIVNTVTLYDSEEEHYKILMNNLIEAVETYSYYKVIPDDELANVQSKTELNELINEHWDFSGKIFGNLINKIIELIKPRLGWTYRLFSEGGALFVQGVNLAIEFIDNIQNLNIAILFATVVNLIVYIPIYYFSESIKDLFNLDLAGFNQKIDEFLSIFSEDLTTLIQIVEDLLIALGEAFEPLVNYVSDVGDFIGWIVNEDPWEQQITVKGTAINLLGMPVEGATVTCRGISTTTNSNGNFEFQVSPSNNSADSIPANSWYGVHNCSITISKDGEVFKRTPTILSYVFSGGEISWPFIIPKAKNKFLSFRTILIEWINSMIEKFHAFFPYFFRN